MYTQTQAISTTQTATITRPKTGIAAWFNRMVMQYDKSRYAAMTLMMTAQSCLGSIACFYIMRTGNNVVLLSLGVMVTMLSNSFFIAQSPAKWCVSGFLVSVMVNLALIVVNLLLLQG